MCLMCRKRLVRYNLFGYISYLSLREVLDCSIILLGENSFLPFVAKVDKRYIFPVVLVCLWQISYICSMKSRI